MASFRVLAAVERLVEADGAHEPWGLDADEAYAWFRASHSCQYAAKLLCWVTGPGTMTSCFVV